MRRSKQTEKMPQKKGQGSKEREERSQYARERARERASDLDKQRGGEKEALFKKKRKKKRS